jgi:hypothetical protein
MLRGVLVTHLVSEIEVTNKDLTFCSYITSQNLLLQHREGRKVKGKASMLIIDALIVDIYTPI